MKKLLLLIIPFVLKAQIPPGYYTSAQGLTGNNLKIALHNIIDNHTVISYSGLWTAFQKTDVKANGKVWDMYSFKPVGAQPYEYTFVTNQCGSYNSESDCYNREHSWPQSWFASTPGPDSDLFHIYPTDGHVNGMRANNPYGNVSNASFTSLNGSKLGTSNNVGYSGTVFEPINEFKGDLARGYFYMSTRYYSEDAPWSSSGATNKATLLQWQIDVLMQWHHQDPVSAKEIARNDSIYYRFQNNRNPFIDHPEWVDSIWTTTITDVKSITNGYKNAFTLSPNPSQDQLTLTNSSLTDTELTWVILALNGQVIDQEKVNFNTSIIINNRNLKTGIYILQVNTRSERLYFKFVKE